MKNITQITLTISERVRALSVLNAFKGSLEHLAIILEDIKQFTVTDEEFVQAERVIMPADENGNVQWTWNDEKGPQKEIALNAVTFAYLHDTIKERSEKGEFSLSDRPFITLFEKLA